MARLFQHPRASAAVEQWWNQNFLSHAFLFLSSLVAIGAAQTIIFAILKLAFNILRFIPGFRILVQALLYPIFLPNRLLKFGVTLALLVLSAISGPILLAIINTVIFHPKLFSVEAKLITLTTCTCLYLYPFMNALGLTWMSWNGEISLGDSWLGWVEVAALGYWAVRGNKWDGGCITSILDEYQSLGRGEKEQDVPYDVKVPLYIHYKGQYRRAKGEWVRRRSSEDISLLDDSISSASMRNSSSSLATIHEEIVPSFQVGGSLWSELGLES